MPPPGHWHCGKAWTWTSGTGAEDTVARYDPDLVSLVLEMGQLANGRGSKPDVVTARAGIELRDGNGYERVHLSALVVTD